MVLVYRCWETRVNFKDVIAILVIYNTFSPRLDPTAYDLRKYAVKDNILAGFLHTNLNLLINHVILVLIFGREMRGSVFLL